MKRLKEDASMLQGDSAIIKVQSVARTSPSVRARATYQSDNHLPVMILNNNDATTVSPTIFDNVKGSHGSSMYANHTILEEARIA